MPPRRKPLARGASARQTASQGVRAQSGSRVDVRATRLTNQNKARQDKDQKPEVQQEAQDGLESSGTEDNDKGNDKLDDLTDEWALPRRARPSRRGTGRPRGRPRGTTTRSRVQALELPDPGVKTRSSQASSSAATAKRRKVQARDESSGEDEASAADQLQPDPTAGPSAEPRTTATQASRSQPIKGRRGRPPGRRVSTPVSTVLQPQPTNEDDEDEDEDGYGEDVSPAGQGAISRVAPEPSRKRGRHPKRRDGDEKLQAMLAAEQGRDPVDDEPEPQPAWQPSTHAQDDASEEEYGEIQIDENGIVSQERRPTGTASSARRRQAPETSQDAPDHPDRPQTFMHISRGGNWKSDKIWLGPNFAPEGERERLIELITTHGGTIVEEFRKAQIAIIPRGPAESFANTITKAKEIGCRPVRQIWVQECVDFTEMKGFPWRCQIKPYVAVLPVQRKPREPFDEEELDIMARAYGSLLAGKYADRATAARKARERAPNPERHSEETWYKYMQRHVQRLKIRLRRIKADKERGYDVSPPLQSDSTHRRRSQLDGEHEKEDSQAADGLGRVSPDQGARDVAESVASDDESDDAREVLALLDPTQSHRKTLGDNNGRPAVTVAPSSPSRKSGTSIAKDMQRRSSKKPVPEADGELDELVTSLAFQFPQLTRHQVSSVLHWTSHEEAKARSALKRLVSDADNTDFSDLWREADDRGVRRSRGKEEIAGWNADEVRQRWAFLKEVGWDKEAVVRRKKPWWHPEDG